MTNQLKEKIVYTSCINYIEEGVEMWGAHGFEPYGEGQDPSPLVESIKNLTPENAACVLNQLNDKLKEPGHSPIDSALDNFTDNVYQDLERETSLDWFEDFKTHFNFE